MKIEFNNDEPLFVPFYNLTQWDIFSYNGDFCIRSESVIEEGSRDIINCIRLIDGKAMSLSNDIQVLPVSAALVID